MKEFKVEIPEGYEIDKEKSTFEKIVFKKKEKVVNCWEDLKNVSGYYINELSYLHIFKLKNPSSVIYKNKNIFFDEKYAKSALALAQISQLLPYYDSRVDWDRPTIKYCICRVNNNTSIDKWEAFYHPMAFNTREEAERFLKHNEQLVKDYFML
jgi:hypothetical protein